MTDERIIAYLLGELPAEESDQFEDECFAEEHWPMQISLAEEDLIDHYLRGELTTEQRQRFEQNYLTTEARKERVVMAASLLRHVDEQSHDSIAEDAREVTWIGRLRASWGGPRWALTTALALASIVIVVGGLLWLYRPLPSRPQTFATLTLTISSNSRGEGSPVSKVKIPPEAEGLRVSLKLPDGLPQVGRYRIQLENEKGETKPVELAGQETQSVSVLIPSAQLTPGEHVLKLFIVKDDGTEQRIPGSYLFIVE
ncbi:MAG TPA: hypothetical protein VF779_05490 [Pyrinomonadaceae bacterium]